MTRAARPPNARGMGLTVDLQRLRAHRQRGLACSNAMMGEVL